MDKIESIKIDIGTFEKIIRDNERKISILHNTIDVYEDYIKQVDCEIDVLNNEIQKNREKIIEAKHKLRKERAVS